MPEIHSEEERFDRNELARYRRRDMTPQGVQSGNLLGYEQGDANIRAVIQTMLILGGSLVVIFLFIFGAFRYFNGREHMLKDKLPMGSQLMAQQPVPPNPRLFPSPLQGSNELPWDEMAKERASAEERANVEGSSEMQKAERKTGAIPVADAMTQIARENGDKTGKGLPAYSTLTNRSPLYPPSWNWERADEKQNVEASGGRVLQQPIARTMRPVIRTQKPNAYKAPNTVNKAADPVGRGMTQGATTQGATTQGATTQGATTQGATTQGATTQKNR